MKYVIYEMVRPSLLKEVVQDGYSIKTNHSIVLQELSVNGVESTHSTMVSAIAEITNKKDELKYLSLTIIPVFDIAWDGEIRDF